MTFPSTKRYFLDFRNSDTGLAPIFTFFQQTPGFGATTPALPAGGIVEKSNGRYYFDWIWLTKTDSDIVFQVDGGASIPTEEVRYIKGTISPKDAYVDEPVSQVVTDVWTDAVGYAAGQKGLRVDQLGDPADTSAAATMFGKELLYKESIRGDSAGSSDGENVKLARDRIMGGTGFGGTGVDVKTVNDGLALAAGDVTAIKAKTDNLPLDPADASDVALAITNSTTSIKGGDNRDLTQIAGAGFVSGTDSLAALAVIAGGITAGQVAAAVWDALLSGHTTPSTFGSLMATVALTTDVTTAVTTIQGVGGPTLGAIAGSGFVTGTHSLKLTSEDLKRALGMLHENSVLDQTSFNGSNNLLTGRMRIYDSKANADLAVAASPGIYDTGKIAEYAVVATYTGGGTNLETYKVSREA